MFDSLSSELESDLDPRDVEAIDAEYERQVADMEQTEYDAETEQCRADEIRQGLKEDGELV